jgi:uncharacterized repeat protein (TIGR04052 family)
MSFSFKCDVLRSPMFATVSVVAAAAAIVSGCGDNDVGVDINVAPLLGGKPFICNQTFTEVGTSKSTVSIKDFKMYVHDVELLDAAGKATPVILTQDQRWQRGGLALLDFDDGTGDCAPGTKDMNTRIRGSAPAGDYRGIRFTVGVPAQDNHLDAATSPVPLNEPGMWWSWKGGFKYVRLDVATRKNPSYYLHLGATSCEGTPGAGYTCTAGNAPVISLNDFVVGQDEITLDVGTMWSSVDIDNQIDFQSDFVQGCMAFEGDPECPAVFEKLGMGPNGMAMGTQSVFAKRSAL